MRERTERGRAVRRLVAAALPFAVLLGLWGWLFFPVLFRGENLMGYRLLDPRYTGLDPALAKRSLFNRLPSQDASLLQTHLPLQYFLAGHLRGGHIPLWNPSIGCGAPVAPDPQYKPWNPFFWLFFLAPSPWTFSLGIALLSLFGALGWGLLLRRWNLPPWVTAAGAALLTWNPLTVQTVVLSNPWAAWVFPWVLLAVEAYASGNGAGLPLAAAASALMVYAGHPLSAVLHTALAASFLAFRLGLGERRRLLGGLVVWGVLLLALAAVHLLPLAADHGTYWSYKTEWDGGPYHSWLSLANPKSEIYVPLPLWGLALAGLAGSLRRERLFFAGAAAYGAVVMFPWVGGPLRWLLTFGGMLVARYGAEAFWFGLLGLSILGMEGLAEEREWKGRGRLLRCLVYGSAWYLGLGWVSVLTDSLFWPQVYRRLFRWEVAALVPLLLLAVLPPGALRVRKGLSAAFLVLVLLLPRLPHGLSRYFSAVDLVAEPPALVRKIQEQRRSQAGVRWIGSYTRLDLMAVLCPNQSLLWGLEDARATTPLMLGGFRRFASHYDIWGLFGTYAFFPRQDESLLAFLGVNWLVASPGREVEGLQTVAQAGPLVLQQVKGQPSWVRPVGAWEVASGEEDLWRKTFASLRSGTWRHTAVLERGPGLDRPGGTARMPEVAWIEGGPNRWSWRLSGGDACVLQILMNHHPNWRAWVDGRPVPLLRAFGTFMAVAVPAGEHTVTLLYREPWFWAGLGVTGAGWAGVAAWLVRWRVKGRRIAAGGEKR